MHKPEAQLRLLPLSGYGEWVIVVQCQMSNMSAISCWEQITFLWIIDDDVCCVPGDVMVKMLASSAVDRGFESRSGQTKDYKIGICCFSTKHAALKGKSKNWLAQNQYNVSRSIKDSLIFPINE
jgi:hypothetical protein